MIPLRLTIQGVFSYQEKQVIDFTKLTAAHLFGVFGTVGSGKSAILDCITYALYGDFTRMNQRGDKAQYNMMNLKSKTLLIDFEFAAANNTRYRFVVEGKRNSRRFEDISKWERRAFQLEGENWLPLENANAQSLLNLRYTNFRRTIIIPQGTFQEFLQLGAKERTTMLSQLFNLGTFDLFYKAQSLERKNRSELDRLDGLLSGFEQISPDVLEQKKNALQRFKEEKTSVLSKKKSFDKEKKAAEEIQQILSKKNEAMKKLRELAALETFWNEQYTLCKNILQCRQLFITPFTQEKDLRDRQADLSSRLTKNRELRDKKYNERVALAQKMESCQKEFNDIGRLQKLVMDLKSIAELKKVDAMQQTQRMKIETLNDGLKKTEQTIQTVIRQIEQKKIRREQIRKEIPHGNTLFELDNWFKKRADLIRRMNTLSVEQKNAQTALTKATEKLDAVSLPEGVELSDRERLQSSSGVRAAAVEHFIDMQEQCSGDLQERLNNLHVRSGLEQYAGSLEEGEPCPLCGSREHPHIGDFENLAEDIEQAKREIQRCTNAIREARGIVKKLQNTGTELEIAQRQVQSAQVQYQEAREQVSSHDQTFSSDRYSIEDHEKVIAAIETARGYDKELQRIEKDLEDLQKKQESTRNQSDVLKEQMALVNNEISSLKGKEESLRNALNIISVEDYSTDSVDVVNEEAERTEKNIARIQKQYNDTIKRGEEAEKTLGILDGTVKAQEQQIQELQQQLDSIIRQIEKLIDHSEYESRSEIETILARDLDIEKTQADYEAFGRELHALKKTVAELSELAEGKTFDEDRYRALCKDLSEIESELETLHKQTGALESEITSLQKDLQTQKETLEQITSLKNRADTIAVLKNLFKGSGFVNYVSTVYLQQLCAAANKRFSELTRRRLQLELEEDNSFCVRDYLNGGHTRSVKTLSGGQTFQASLSLALALVEQVQQFSKSKQNFFFLDEGFGSQDQEALRLVFDTLKSLRKENRTVGVISHVEELKQEIETFIRIDNKEDKGSVVIGSWEQR